MSDFDFDELDKAVSNVLGDSTARNEAQQMSGNRGMKDGNTAPESTDASSVSDSGQSPASGSDTAPVSPAEPPSPTEPAPESSPKTPSIITPRSSINRKAPASTNVNKAGVIDIMAPPSKRPSRESSFVQPMRPASDAKTDDEPAAPQKRASREDAALRWPPKAANEEDISQPTESTETPTSERDTSPEAAPAPIITMPTAATPAASEPATPDAAEGSLKRFDSLSRSGFDFDDPAEPKKEEPPVDDGSSPQEPKPEDTLAEGEEASGGDEKETTGSQSPFLSDAKVEKRPLGSFSSFSHSPMHSPEPEVAKPDDASSEPLTSDKTTAQPQDGQPAESIKLDHLLTDGHEHEKHHADAPSASTPPPASSAQPKGMESIPQQYKVADQPADDVPHPIFDTKEYHAPLHGHDTKVHRSGNGLLIASIILLVLAVAAATGIYFYGDKLGL